MASENHVKEYGRRNVPNPGNPSFNEAWALIEAARRIGGVVQFGDFSTPQDKRKLRDALRLNLRIWTIIQAEQTVNDDLLPPDVRQNILTLCKFVDRHTLDTMIEPTPERAAVLININRNIAAGLLGSSEDELDAMEAPQDAVSEEPTDDAAPSADQQSEPAPVKINI